MINILIIPNLKNDKIDDRFKELFNLFKNSSKYNKKIYSNTLQNIEYFYENSKELNENQLLKLKEKIEIEKYDIILCNKINENIINLNKPIILCERYDSCTISKQTNLKYLENSNVKALFKEYVFKNKNNYYNYYIENRYHFHLLNKNKNNIKNKKINENIVNKIKCITWNLKQYSNICNYNMRYINKYINLNNNVNKSIDLFLVCHLHENKKILYEHRKKIINIIDKFSKKYKHIKIKTGKLEMNDYNDNLIKSKICIAPYGLGSRIALDQLGILAKTIVIKPPMNFVKSNPYIYKETMDFFEYCDINWSNLENIILNILNNYERYRKIAENRRNKLLKYNEEYYMNKMYHEIKKYLQ